MSKQQQGYVFINGQGLYVAVVPNTGFGSARQIVVYVASINDATVFTTPNAYYGTLLDQQSRANILKHCQCLKAVSTVSVTLSNWSDKDEAQQ